MTKLMMLSAGAAVAAVLVAGCSGNTADQQAKNPAATSTAMSAPAPGSEAEQEANNDADVMFAQHMIPHHQQAVEMSDVLLAKTGIDARVSQLATQIKAAQAPEIAQMQGWLKDWGNPPMPSMTHGDMGHDTMPAMQGMVSEADMTALRNAQGVEAAKLYLTHMIAHHEGAITMAKDEIDRGEYADAIEMARAIVTTQEQEIDTMRQILGTL
ncbi:uncharacterized protein (DUF305 family) [Mycobacterium frederiksbergense]|uniref:Uncharacterized protein (DUF305 family) n=1 Tax=Mycolicibacterium frederiksbergense TaxID=117567 RepID=A0ABT6L3H1_9MYCO|nr:DUF305 domain-containing protein [Mycolicibacterium frederiksbergense]MDH6197498.1 uncharacterized protein (DUF305 family) [Mycolicibacterium frederiksbergense]